MVAIGREAPGGPGRRGDIHIVEFPDLGGHVLRGPHPAVVVRTNLMQRSTTVQLVPMTSSPRSAPENPRYLVAVPGRAAGLPRDGFVKCDQIATLPAALLGPRVGRLSPELLERVDRALRFVLDL